MRRLILLAGLVAACPAGAAAPTEEVVVLDHCDPREVEETIAVFFDGVFAGSFHLDAAHPSAAIRVRLPAAPSHEYALCGRIVIRGPDGQPEVHEVDQGGVLGALGGRVVEALAAADFRVFFLSPADERPDAPPPQRRARACSAPVA